jgi:hypothetical protein
MSKFQDMKKATASSMERIAKEVEKMAKGSYQEDERFWKPNLDKSGNGYAVIRFLPPPENEEVPWVRLYQHYWKENGKVFSENCGTTIGKKCPICEENSEYYNDGTERGKAIASTRKRKQSFISNIYVVEDPTNRENEGKVFLYRYGITVFDKITAKLGVAKRDSDSPSVSAAAKRSVVVYDFWKGANFILDIHEKGGFSNYDNSAFDSVSPLLDGDDSLLEDVWKRQHSLMPFIAPEQFKSYEEVAAKFREFKSLVGKATADTATEVAKRAGRKNEDEDEETEDKPQQSLAERFAANKKDAEPKPKSKPSNDELFDPKPKPKSSAAKPEAKAENEALSYFRSLSEED